MPVHEQGKTIDEIAQLSNNKDPNYLFYNSIKKITGLDGFNFYKISNLFAVLFQNKSSPLICTSELFTQKVKKCRTKKNCLKNKT